MSNVAHQRGNGQKRLGGITGKGFMPGQSGNPAGRPSAGAAIAEWYNQMKDWSIADLQGVTADANAPASKLAAANQWLRGIMNGTELDRICDRTDGKPKQAVEMNATGEVRFTLNIGRPGGDEPSDN